MMKDQVVEPLNWTPGAGIVTPVHPDLIPRFKLPTHATTLQHDGRPAYHVTLIKRRALEGCGPALAEVWPAVLADPPPVPIAKPRAELIEATDPSTGTVSWIVELDNAYAFESLRLELTNRLNHAFEAAGYRGLRVGHNPVRWHITIANNRGGDPFQSFSDPHRFLNSQRRSE